MAVYLMGFATSVALIALTEKKQRKIFFLGSVAALLIPCLIAALRADNIGTDVEVYIKPLMKQALAANSMGAYYDGYWFVSWRNQYVIDYEYGFSFLVFWLTKLFRSQQVVLFVIQALILVPIYTALARNRGKIPVWLGMLVFYLLFFNASLNMMRQWIAMAFLLLAFQFLTEKKYFQTALLCITALLFHYSAVIVLPIYAVYWFLNLRHGITLREGNLTVTGRTLAVIFVSLAALLLVLNLDVVLKLMSAVGFDRFSHYLKGNQMTLLVNQVILRFPLIFLFVVNWKHFCAETRSAPFYMTMLMLDLVAAQLISIDTYAFRIGQYFLLYVILAAPHLYACRKDPFPRRITAILLVAYLLLYWYYTYVVQLRHETYPYRFCF